MLASNMLVAQKQRARREDFNRHEIVSLEQTVLADQFDSEFATFYAKNPGGTAPLLIDFADAKFIDIAVLVNCVAILVDRTEKGYESKIGLPKNRSVLDFLRVWRFLEAIEDVTRGDYMRFVLEGDRDLLNAPQRTYTGIGSALDVLEYDPDWTEGNGRLRNFFQFITFSHPAGERIQPNASFSGIPRALVARWSGALIQQVLKRHLGEGAPQEDVARVLLYESIGNAVRHPDAGRIQVVSKFSRRPPNTRGVRGSSDEPSRQPARDGSLRICIWDDGKSIADTLLPIVAAGKPIRTFGLPSYMCETTRVELRRFDETVTSVRFVNDGEPLTQEQANEAHLLFASFYPGVSRDVAQSIPKVEPYDGKVSANSVLSQLSGPGMGLYALRRTVLDQFQGQLFVRSGRYRLVMEVAHDQFRVRYKVRYKAKITEYPDTFPPFRGNLLALDLPIKSALSSESSSSPEKSAEEQAAD